MIITFTKDRVGPEKPEKCSDVFSLKFDLPEDTTWKAIVPLLKAHDFFDAGDYVWVLNDNFGHGVIAYYSFCDKTYFFDTSMKSEWLQERKNVCTMADGKPLNFLRQSRKQRARSLFEGYSCSDYMMWHEGVEEEFYLCDIPKEEKDSWEKEYKRGSRKRKLKSKRNKKYD